MWRWTYFTVLEIFLSFLFFIFFTQMMKHVRTQLPTWLAFHPWNEPMESRCGSNLLWPLNDDRFPPKIGFFFVRVQWFNQEKKNSIPTNEVTNCSPELIYESALQSMRPDERCAGHFKLAHFINHLWPSRFISGAVCAEQMVVRILWRPIFWYGARNGKLANKFSINLIFY